MGMRRNSSPSDLAIFSYESQQLLGKLWEPVPRRWPDGWLALPLPCICWASAPGGQQGKPGGGWQKQTQIQVGFSLEQCQIRSVTVPQQIILLYIVTVSWDQMWFFFVLGNETPLFLFLFQVGPWSRNPNLERALRWSCWANRMSSRIKVRHSCLLKWSLSCGSKIKGEIVIQSL